MVREFSFEGDVLFITSQLAAATLSITSLKLAEGNLLSTSKKLSFLSVKAAR
jgi:hypothetical protein